MRKDILIATTFALALIGCNGDGESQQNAQPSQNSPQVVAPGTVELAGVAKVEFPVGAADGRIVTVSTVESAVFQNDFSETAAALFDAEVQNDYQIKVSVSGGQPTRPVTATISIPSQLRSQAPANSEVRVFFLALQTSDEEAIETVEPLPERFAATAESVVVTVPPEAFQGDSTTFQTYEAILFMGYTPTARASASASSSPFAKAQSKAADSGQCGGTTLRAPVDAAPGSRFGMRIHPITGVKTLHSGVDYPVPNGTDVKAMADGVVDKVGFNEKVKNGKKLGWGHYVVVRHSDGSMSLYAHLEGGTALAVGHAVTAGTTVVAKSDTSGGSTGPHLHVEFAPNGKIFNSGTKVDPLACIGNAAGGPIQIHISTGVDDAFEVFLEGFSVCGAGGGSNTCTLDLRKGQYALDILCTVAPDNEGRYSFGVSSNSNDILVFWDNHRVGQSGTLRRFGRISVTLIVTGAQ